MLEFARRTWLGPAGALRLEHHRILNGASRAGGGDSVFVPQAPHLCALAPRSSLQVGIGQLPPAGGERQLRVRLKDQRRFDRARCRWVGGANNVICSGEQGCRSQLCKCLGLRRAKPSVWLTDLTLSCAAGLACRSRSGAPVAAIKLKQRDASCNWRDAAALATRQAARLPGRSRAAPASA
jgi:hypothetical protein